MMYRNETTNFHETWYVGMVALAQLICHHQMYVY